jgi:integrase
MSTLRRPKSEPAISCLVAIAARVIASPPANMPACWRGWIASIGLAPSLFGTHSLRRTKATLIYRRTGNLRAVQLLLGHTKVESTVRYLGIEVDDALAIAEQIDV